MKRTRVRSLLLGTCVAVGSLAVARPVAALNPVGRFLDWISGRPKALTGVDPVMACFLNQDIGVNPAAGDADDRNAYWLGAMAWLAYVEPEAAKKRASELGFDGEHSTFIEKESIKENKSIFNVKRLLVADTQTYVLEHPQYTIVNFRGSEFGTLDMRTDLMAWLQNFDDMGKSHAGFELALNVVMDELIERLAQIKPPKPVYITGHSLGGAISVLLEMRLLKRLKDGTQPVIPLAGVFTYGSPRVGNKKLMTTLEAMELEERERRKATGEYGGALPVVHYQNDWDIVTTVPFGFPTPLTGFDSFARLPANDTRLFHKDEQLTGKLAHKKAPSRLRLLLRWRKTMQSHMMPAYLVHIAKRFGMDLSYCLERGKDADDVTAKPDFTSAPIHGPLDQSNESITGQ